MYKLTLVFWSMILALQISPMTGIEQNALVQVDVISQPIGAAVEINGKPIGNTPTKTQLTPGKYQIRVALPGFEEKTYEQIIYGESILIQAQLNPGNQFTPFSEIPRSVEWSTNDNILNFESVSTSGTQRSLYAYDILKGELQKVSQPFATLNDQTLRTKLNIASPNDKSIFAIAYQSPSKRYISYVKRGSLPRLVVYDVQTNNTLETAITFDDTQTDRVPFTVIWSSNEKAVWIRYTNENTPIFVLIENGKSETIVIRQFKSQTGELRYAFPVDGGTRTRPNDLGQALIRGVSENGSSRLFLVDLRTQIGVPLPIETPIYDAVFSPDSQWVYIAYENGIVRIKTNNFESRQVVTNVISSRWGVQRVSLSYTLDYALVVGTSNPPTLLYKLPKVAEP